MKTTKALFAVATVAASALLWAACTHGARLAPGGTMIDRDDMARSAAQTPQPLTNAVVAARVDSMVRAYMAEKGPASMSVAITRGSDTLVLRA